MVCGSKRLADRFLKSSIIAGRGWLMPVILATQEERSGASWFKTSPGKWFKRPCLKNTHHKKGLVEWLKV
jgi:hypothetical protein